MSKQPFDWRTRHLQVNANHWPFLQGSIVLSNQLQELLWMIMSFSKCDLWIEINERIVETACTIFTAGSLKASRTETRKATTTIVIKTGCSILTRVTFTRQDFCHGNIWGEGRWWQDRQVILEVWNNLSSTETAYLRITRFMHIGIFFGRSRIFPSVMQW